MRYLRFWFLVLMGWGVVLPVAQARSLLLTWQMESPLPWPHTGFMVQSCMPSPRGICTMKDAGGVAAWQRQILVTVPNNPTRHKCFQVQTLRGTARSAASERLCILEHKE